MKPFSPLRLLALLASLLAFLPLQLSAQAAAEPAKFVFVMSSGAMPTAGSGLHLAITAAASGRSVDIVLVASALDLGRKGAGNGPVFPTYGVDGPAMLVQAMAAGARVSVCRTCLLNQSIDIDDMLDGIARINAFNFLDLTEAADVVLSFGAPDAGTGISFAPVAAMAPAEAAPAAAGSEPPCDPATDKDACM
ncbi:MAG: DsrE family protein [Phaeovulum sp.]|uniref:DsrE family protein n=1 Tax=Phaeovulum sp. TaxID=2934796 RepID=UPI0027335C73|nr:DsrE family protein [Phaeovulum sp.]MDP3861715.1 DsrE family protein [Phaeovulum sp.]